MLPSEITDVINADSADHPPSPPLGSVPCSICLDLVIDDGQRSIAKLPCGHKFHLDCIGSAFNTKRAMQCPNCRRVESGRWLFADGSARVSSEMGARDWVPHEGPHDLSYSRQPIGVHWRPFGGFMGHSSIEETEASLNTVANFVGNYALITDHTAAVAPASARPYISYPGPNEHVANSNFHHPLNSHPAPSNIIRSTYIQHPTWGWNCHFIPYNADIVFIDHGNVTPVNPTATPRSTHVRPQPQPIYHAPRPVSRTRENTVANSQSRERNPIRQATYHHEQPSVVTITPSSTNGLRISGGALAVPIIVPVVTRQPHNRGVHGVYTSETERDESAYAPVIRGTYNRRRP